MSFWTICQVYIMRCKKSGKNYVFKELGKSEILKHSSESVGILLDERRILTEISGGTYICPCHCTSKEKIDWQTISCFPGCPEFVLGDGFLCGWWARVPSKEERNFSWRPTPHLLGSNCVWGEWAPSKIWVTTEDIFFWQQKGFYTAISNSKTAFWTQKALYPS